MRAKCFCRPGTALKLMLLACVACGLIGAAPAQEYELDPEQMVQSAEQWAAENLDDRTLSALKGVDRQQVQHALTNVQHLLKGEYVLDLAQLKALAETALPILEQHEETLPYALWLRTRLDYFEVARQLRPPAPPKPLPSPMAKINPSAVTEREIWIKKVASRPWPPAATPYVSKLKPVFAAEKVPPQLVWIAEVESSFDPRARSPDGATGLFQLMPATARQYGLRTAWPLDQRVKPEPSARAAAKHLRQLYLRYHDWRLAVAAYNAGQGRVDRLLAGAKTRNYDTIARELPAETQLYVPKVEATIARREGVNLAEL